MLAPWKKSYDKTREHIKKQRHHFCSKGLSSQSYGFPYMYVRFSMYVYESWTIKKGESRRIGSLKLWCWRRLLRVPWTTRRSNQSILKKINPEYSLERLMLKLKLHTLATWCKELTHWKRPRCWERLKAEGDNRGQDGRTASLTQWTHVWVSSRRCEGQWSLVCCSPWGHRVEHDRVTEQQCVSIPVSQFHTFLYVPLPLQNG